MSAIPDAISGGLPLRSLPGKLWQYLKVAGPFFGGVVLLKIAGAAGFMSALLHSFVHQDAVSRIVLSTNPVTLDYSRGLPLATFAAVALGRALLGDVINYYFAQRSAVFLRKEASGRIGRWLANQSVRLEESHPSIILGVVGGLTFATAWSPWPLLPGSPIWIAGSARVRLVQVIGVQAVARIAFLYLFWRYGPPWQLAANAV